MILSMQDALPVWCHEVSLISCTFWKLDLRLSQKVGLLNSLCMNSLCMVNWALDGTPQWPLHEVTFLQPNLGIEDTVGLHGDFILCGEVVIFQREPYWGILGRSM